MRLDRNTKARVLFRAEALDRRTHQPGQHGGILKRTGIVVLKALLGHLNTATGRCDPSYDTIARNAGVARGSVGPALWRLENAELIVRHRRQVGCIRYSNAYVICDPGAVPSPRGTPKNKAWSKNPTNQKTEPLGAKTMPATVGEPPPMAIVLARVRAALRADYEAIVRHRAERLARQTTAG